MFSMEDEVHVQQIDGLLVRHFVEEHFQEVPRVVQGRVGAQRAPAPALGGGGCIQSSGPLR